MNSPRRRGATAGALLVAVIVLAVLDGAGLAPLRVTAGACAWAAAALLWRELATGQRRQCAALVGIGLAAMTFAWARGGAAAPGRLLYENLGLIAMIAGVSFIRLAAAPARSTGRRAPRGPLALLSTLAGLNVLGAAINMTALVLVGDRLARNGPLGAVHGALLARAFSLAVLYSPFIGGMAFALNRAPDANLAGVAAYGAVLVAAGIGGTWLWAARTRRPLVDGFDGYPFSAEALWFPALLAAAVLAVHFAFGEVPVLTVIAALAPLGACSALAARVGTGRATVRALEHVVDHLPRMAGELWLFLSAGVLAAGLASFFAAVELTLPLDSFGGLAASAALLAVILASAAGLHPVIGLSALVPLLEPLEPAPLLLALLCVCGWSIGCTVCPYSGINLVLQGRYGLDAWNLSRRSLGYAALMWLAASALFWVAAGGP